jgi:hypothetical protein
MPESYHKAVWGPNNDPRAAQPARHARPGLAHQILKAGGEFVGKSAKALALLYSLKSVPVSGLHIADHSLDGCAQLMRCYGGTLTDCTIERISHLNGVYKPGIGRGIFLSANTTLTNLTIRNVVYQSGDPITNPGDVYGGITLGARTPTISAPASCSRISTSTACGRATLAIRTATAS